MEALLVLLGAAAAILSGWVTRRIEFGYERQRQRDDARMADSVALQDAVDELNRAYSLGEAPCRPLPSTRPQSATRRR
jgi:hypothetical protein